MLINLVLILTNPKLKNYIKRSMEKATSGSIKWYHWLTKNNLIFADFSDLMHCQALNAVFSGFLVSFIKTQVGEPRPDFFDRCFPSVGVSNLDLVQDKIANLTRSMSNDWDNICEEQDRKIVRGGLLSFPSGHSCNSMSAGIIISLYIWGKLSAFSVKNRANESEIIWRVLAGFPGIVFGLWVACSRISDYRHHYIDVFCGSLLGFICTVFFYNVFYPSVKSEVSQWSFSQLEAMRKFCCEECQDENEDNVNDLNIREIDELNESRKTENSIVGICL